MTHVSVRGNSGKKSTFGIDRVRNNGRQMIG